MPISNPSSSGGATTLLDDTTLGANGTLDLSNISQDYDHLEIWYHLRSTVSADNDSGRIYFNNDTTATNYRRIIHYGDGATSAAAEGDTSDVLTMPAATSTAGDFAEGKIFIQWYTGGGLKNAQSVGGMRKGASNLRAYHYVVNWENTAAITRITIAPDGSPTDSLLAGSRWQVVGIKATAAA